MIVGVSTDEFNELKGKKTIISYEQRSEIVKNLNVLHGDTGKQLGAKDP